jgi:hypothetical protein
MYPNTQKAHILNELSPNHLLKPDNNRPSVPQLIRLRGQSKITSLLRGEGGEVD